MKNNDSTIYNQDRSQSGDNGDTTLISNSTIAETRNTDTSINDSSNSFLHANVSIEKGNTILDLYKVESDPIIGGMGRVLRVHHMGWNVDLAMKQPKRELFRTEKQKENFIKECEYWINLGLHLHIVSCYYVREIDGIPSIFSEWMNGGSLKNFIESGKLYEGDEKDVLQRILDISIQFARGLHYAHEQTLIHQDVKPDNVLLSDEGTVKVTDFGIANAKTILEASDPDTLSESDTIISESGAYTPAYCSPEQVKGKKLTRRTDIWSWAVSVLEMFMGERLWQDGVVAGLACEDYFGTEQVEIPETMKNLLRRCFQEKETDRPHDFKEIEEILLKIYQLSTGKAYNRPAPKAAAKTADNLNNRALSFLDLEKPEEAEKCWELALETNPEHTVSLYNRSVNLWKKGEIDDEEAIRMLEAKAADTDYYVARLHIARGDAQSAVKCLDKAIEINGETDEIKNALALAHEIIRDEKDGQCIYEWEAKYLWEASKEWKRSFMKADLFNTVCFSPNGSKILSGGKAFLKMWDVDSKECVHSFEEHESTAACFSPDGSKILSGCEYRTLKLRDMNTGTHIRTFEGHNSNIIAVCFNPDSTKALSADDRTIRVWDVNTGVCIHSFEVQERFTAVCFSPDSTKALSGNEQTLNLWDINTGTCIRLFGEHDDRITAVCFSPDGTKALSGSSQAIRLWNVDSGKCIQAFKGNIYSTNSVCFSPDGNKILSGSGRNEKGIVKLWDIPTGRCIRTFEGHHWSVRTVSYSPDGKHALSACSYRDTSMKLWRIPETDHLETILSKIHSTKKVTEQESLFNRLISETNTLIKNRKIPEAIHKLEEARKVQQFGKADTYYDVKKKLSRFCIRRNIIANQIPLRIIYSSNAATISFDVTGKWILCGESSGKLTLSDACTGKQIKTFEGHTDTVISACFSPDSIEILSGSFDKTMKLWDINSGKCIHTFEGHNNSIRAVCFSPNARLVVSGSADAIAVWSSETKNCGQYFNSDDTHHPNSVFFNLYGDQIIVGYDQYRDYDKILKLWDVRTGECIHTFNHKGRSDCSALSPDGNTIVSGARTKAGFRIMLWDIKTKECIADFPSDTPSEDICFSPDGRYILSGGGKYAKLWDVHTKKCIQTFEMPDVNVMSPVKSVCFSPDSTKIALTSGKEVLIYNLDYDLHFPGWNNWDEGARPYLNVFLKLYPGWTDDDLRNKLIPDLQNRGYGWLRTEGIRAKLKEAGTGGMPQGIQKQYKEKKAQETIPDTSTNKRSFWKRLFKGK